MALTRPTPAPGTWTYDDLLTLPDDGTRYEIIEGVLYEMPAPTWAHATIIMNLIANLLPVVQAVGGMIRTAPLDVFFFGANPVQPDIVVLLPDSQARPSRRGVEGRPDLVIEILSPSNRGHDLLTKRALYGRAGVREYWIVDPEARTLDILVLDGDVLRGHQTLIGENVIASPLLPAVVFSASALFVGVDLAPDAAEA